MKQVLVTGAAGFLGSHLCQRLLANNYQVIGVDNFSTGSISNMTELQKNSQFAFYQLDVVTEINKLELAFKNLHLVYHLASPASPQHYQRLSIETLLVNSTGLQNCLQLATNHNARLIFTSTSEVYGDPKISPQAESYFGHVNSFGERSCYDEAKRFGEALIYSWNKRFSTRHGIVRIFNTFGPNMQISDGRIVLNFICQALTGQPMSIYGQGLQTRSLCYVDDLITGLIKYADSQIADPINLGGEKELSVLNIAEIIKRLTQSQSEFQFKPLPADDPKQRRPDITQARNLLNWEPKVSIEEGLLKTITWAKTQNIKPSFLDKPASPL